MIRLLQSDAQVLGPVQHGLIKLDQPDILDHILVRVERNRTLEPLSGLPDHARVGRGAVAAVKVIDASLKRIQPVHDPLDPALGQLGLIGFRSILTFLGRTGVGRTGPVRPGFRFQFRFIFVTIPVPVSAEEEVVPEQSRAGTGHGDLGALARKHLPNSRGCHAIRGLLCAVLLPIVPLENHIFRVGPEIRGVAQSDLLVEHVVRVNGLDGPAILVVHHFDDMQRDRQTPQGGMVVLGHRHIEITFDVRGRIQKGRAGNQRKSGPQSHPREWIGFSALVRICTNLVKSAGRAQAVKGTAHRVKLFLEQRLLIV